MNWTNKLYELRTDAILELGKIANRCDERERWNESYENDTQYRYDLPCEQYQDDGFYTNYSIVYFDGESFLGYNWDDGEEFWFKLDELETETICKLIDFINESD